MSFGRNDSFGQNEVEDSNVILTEGKDVNNISFEGNNNEVSPRIDDDNKNSNDIFNQIPMEINSEANEKQSFFQYEYLIQQIYSSVYRLFKIINDKIKLRRLCAFLLIHNYSQKKKMIIIKAENVYINIVSSLRNCIRIHRRKRKQLKLKYFIKWKEEYATSKQLSLLKEQIESAIEKRNEREYTELNSQLNQKEREANDLNKNLMNLQTFESELKRRLKTFEEKETSLLDKIKVLEQKNNKYKELISNRNTKSSGGSEFRTYENKVKQLEAQISTMQEDNKDKDNTINTFMKDMNDILLYHEQNIESFQQEENMKRLASSKGANSNMICFTTGSVNNKRPSSSLRNNYSKSKNNYSNVNK